MTAINDCGFELVEQPPYSPDLAPSDFHLCPQLKRVVVCIAVILCHCMPVASTEDDKRFLFDVTNAHWSEWSTYGACSVTCGVGVKTRQRQCSGGASFPVAQTCNGKSSETVVCSLRSCSSISLQQTDSLWGPWSDDDACSVTCGVGVRARHRQCYVRSQSSPPCAGSATDSQVCSLPACSSTSSQTSCSDVVSNCHDLDETQAVCSKFPSWAKDNCNKFCGFCHVTTSAVCDDSLSSCQLYGVSVCSNYTAWARAHCNKFCGFCQAPNTIATSQPLHVDGGWTSWSDLTSCSSTCGNGVVQRVRSCTNPPPSSGGAFCQGNSLENYPCNLRPCLNTVTINGGWSSWNGWTACSVTCNTGVQSRERTCTNPAPSSGGAGCPGNTRESRACTAGSCAGWTHWFDGTCSASCGQGQRERLRHCSTGHDDDCPGDAYEIVTCYGDNC